LDNRRTLNIPALALPAAVLCFNLLLILFPQETIAAAREGLLLWFNNVLPSLLPFIVGANLLMCLGAARFLSVLLDPMMRALFGIGGDGGFAITTGLLSGYPVGTKVTAELYESAALPRDEAQRLAAFAANAGPLFLIGAIANGMFNSTTAGYLLLAAHYGGALLTAFLFSLPAKLSGKTTRPVRTPRPLRHALHSMAEARRADGRPFGAILAWSVQNAMETLLRIGGYIILFGVIVRALTLIGLPPLLESLAAPLSSRLHWPDGLVSALLTGLVEMTNGARQAGAFGATRIGLTAAIAIVSWGGLSVHAQAIGYLSKAKLRAAPYLAAKLVHAAIAAFLGFCLFPFFETALTESIPAATFPLGQPWQDVWWTFIHAAALLILSLLVPILCALVWHTGRCILRRKNIFRKWFQRRG